MLQFQTENRKLKLRRFSLIRLPFVHCANGSFFICPFVNKASNGSYPFAKGLNGQNRLNGLNGLAHLC